MTGPPMTYITTYPQQIQDYMHELEEKQKRSRCQKARRGCWAI